MMYDVMECNAIGEGWVILLVETFRRRVYVLECRKRLVLISAHITKYNVCSGRLLLLYNQIEKATTITITTRQK